MPAERPPIASVPVRKNRRQEHVPSLYVIRFLCHNCTRIHETTPLTAWDLVRHLEIVHELGHTADTVKIQGPAARGFAPLPVKAGS